MGWSDYVLKRAAFTVVTIFVAISLNFLLFRVLPGTAVSSLARVPNATIQLKRHLTTEFGLNLSLRTQYLDYLRQLFRGNLGISFANQQPVTSNLAEALFNTLPVVTVATVLSLVLGIATGVLSAWRRGTVLDQLSTNSAIVLYALPTQWIALLLLIAFARYLPTAGTDSPFAVVAPPFWQHLGDVIEHMVLPATTLVLTLYGGNTLIVRSALLETLGEDYMLTARAKGIGRGKMMWAHALRNAMLPTITVLAQDVGLLIGGIVAVETIFAYPGIGRLLVYALERHDLPLMQAAILIMTAIQCLANLAADLLYCVFNPKIRYGRALN